MDGMSMAVFIRNAIARALVEANARTVSIGGVR